MIVRNVRGLDLSGLTVLTEAATREYAVTPVIAAAAGARVYALASSTLPPSTTVPIGMAEKFIRTEDAEATVNDFATMCGVRERVEVVTEKRQMVVEQADIVTNLRGLRPLDKDLVGMMKFGAIILCMHDRWEYREEDVDLAACKAAKIPVIYTDEGELFNYCGALCVKLLFEAGVEVYRSRIVIVGGECKFADIAATFLDGMGAEVVVSGANWITETHGCDAVVMADLQSVMAAGDGLNVPIIRLAEDGHMPQTLAHLGAKPVIEIHALGFKTAAEFLAGRKIEGRKRSHKSSV